MAKKRPKPDRHRRIPPEMTVDEDPFGTPAPEEATHNDIFSSLAEFASDPTPPDPELSQPTSSAAATPSRRPAGRLSDVQKILLFGIVAVAAALVYAIVGRLDRASHSALVAQPEPTKPVDDTSPPAEQRAAIDPMSPGQSSDSNRAPSNAVSQRGSVPLSQSPRAEFPPSHLPDPEPISLLLANRLYANKDFENALLMYEKLYQRLPSTEQNQPMRDFLLLRMALCSKNSGNVAQADSMFRTVSLSRLPILRALARYHQSTALLDRQRYLEAATKAYQTIALIEVVDHDANWATAVQEQCWFMASEALTRHILSLSDADADLPSELWPAHADIDPFPGMDEPQLRALVSSGVEKMEEASLSPQIRRAVAAAGRWSVICNGASIEELLARFAANAGRNIHWTNDTEEGVPENSTRRRPVYLCLATATPQQIVTTAAGSVGLMARMDEHADVYILNPSSYSSLAEHLNLLATESASLWQRLLLASDSDHRVPNGHFALALLRVAQGQLDEAIAEYKLVASRFSKHALAPYALLHSGKLKVRLRDYVGAHEDLKLLVELYPEMELSDQACLDLAEATMKAGLYTEATSLYRKVYNSGLSIESQMESALGAGHSFHEIGDHENAAQWLNRYVELAHDQNRREFHAACLLLGKTYLALHKPQQAHLALGLALKGDLSRQQHVETIGILAKAYVEQGLFLEALHTLEGTTGWQLSQQETVELLLLRADVLRSIGLADKAVVWLREKGQFLPSPELRGKVALKLAKCLAAEGDLEPARKTLSDVFTQVEPGPLAQQIGIELATVCLQLNQPAQAVSICLQLLAHSNGAERGPILALLTDTYRKQGKYEEAMATVVNQYSSAAGDTAAPLNPGGSVGN